MTPSGTTKCWRVAAGLCLHISPVGGALLGSSAAVALVTLVTAEPVPVKHRSAAAEPRRRHESIVQTLGWRIVHNVHTFTTQIAHIDHTMRPSHTCHTWTQDFLMQEMSHPVFFQHIFKFTSMIYGTHSVTLASRFSCSHKWPGV